MYREIFSIYTNKGLLTLWIFLVKNISSGQGEKANMSEIVDHLS